MARNRDFVVLECRIRQIGDHGFEQAVGACGLKVVAEAQAALGRADRLDAAARRFERRARAVIVELRLLHPQKRGHHGEVVADAMGHLAQQQFNAATLIFRAARLRLRHLARHFEFPRPVAHARLQFLVQKGKLASPLFDGGELPTGKLGGENGQNDGRGECTDDRSGKPGSGGDRFRLICRQRRAFGLEGRVDDFANLVHQRLAAILVDHREGLAETAFAAQRHRLVHFGEPAFGAFAKLADAHGLFGIRGDEPFQRRNALPDLQPGLVIGFEILCIACQQEAALADFRIPHEAENGPQFTADFVGIDYLLGVSGHHAGKRQCGDAGPEKHRKGNRHEPCVQLSRVCDIGQIGPEKTHKPENPGTRSRNRVPEADPRLSTVTRRK